MKTSVRLAIASLVVAAVVVAMWPSNHDRPAAPATAAKTQTTVEEMSDVGRAPRRRPAAESDAPKSAVVPAAASMASKRVLRILDETGRPVPDVLVHGPGGGRRSDARGETAFDATDSPCIVRFEDRVAERVVELRGPLTEARIEGLPTLTVDVVDGVTGAAIDRVTWRARVGEGEWIDGAAAPRLPVDRGSYRALDVTVDAPEGKGAFCPFGWRGEVAGRTRRARITVLVYPLHGVRLRAVYGDEEPVEDATVIDAVNYVPFGDRTSWRPARSARSDRDGLIVIAMPRVPYGRACVNVERRSDAVAGCAENVRLDAPDDAAPIKVSLRSVGAEPTTAGDRRSRPRPAGPTASLVVHVAYRDGAPAPGVWIRAAGVGGSTGSDGAARLDEVPVGRCDVVAGDHGFLPTVVAADVGRDETVSIRESAPRTIRLMVVDETGAPRPGALASVESVRVPGGVAEEASIRCSIAQLDGDEERLDPTTGRGGTIELLAPAGTMEYRATLGDAEGKTESSADFVKIVLVPPKD